MSLKHFLRKAFSENNLEMMNNKVTDTLRLSRRRIDCVDYELADVAKYFGIGYDNLHRALDDCLLTHKIFEELKKL